MEKLVLKRSEWNGPEASGSSKLFDGEKYCCLGIHGLQCGIDPDVMEDRLFPSDIGKLLNEDHLSVEFFGEESLDEEQQAVLDRIKAYVDTWCYTDENEVYKDIELTEFIAYINDAGPTFLLGDIEQERHEHLTDRPLDIPVNTPITLDIKVRLLKDLFALKGIEIEYQEHA